MANHSIILHQNDSNAIVGILQLFNIFLHPIFSRNNAALENESILICSFSVTVSIICILVV